MLQEEHGEEEGLELLEEREQMNKDGVLADHLVLEPFLFRSEDTGMHVGHLICRSKLVGLAKAFVNRRRDQWRAWMNLPTFTQKAPMRWSPLMCFMEHTNAGTWVHLARNANYLWIPRRRSPIVV